MHALTPRQAQCKSFIAAFAQMHGYTPSYRQICVGLGMSLKSLSSAQRLVHGLIGRGHVAPIGRGAKRAIRLVEPRCPHCGGELPAIQAPVTALRCAKSALGRVP